jgi:crotonobetainyl-CoA:carnitine CoA-transferase CaiB-like acyl-CoA transferase
MSGALEGIRVIDLTINVLGPLATQILGDMGADIIKVEQPRGDDIREMAAKRNPGMSAYFLATNRNKRSIVLDLKTAAGRDALFRLIDGADVFVHSMRASAADRLGIGYAQVSARNPRIVYAFAPGYSPAGPYADLPAYDDIIQGTSGLAALNRRATGEARYAPTVLADKFCGNTMAAAIGFALFARERTGKGQQVVVPMFETMVSFLMVEHLQGAAFEPAVAPPGYTRVLSRHRRPYPTSDGHVCVLAVTDDQWNRLFGAIGRNDLAADPRFNTVAARSTYIDLLYGLLAEEICQHPTAEWLRRFTTADLPHGPVNDIDDLLRHEHLQATGFFRRFDHPTEGEIRHTDIPVQFSETPGSIARLPPRLGEHTEEVLREAGLSPAEIAAVSGRV